MRVELLTSEKHIEEMERAAALAALTCHANTDREFVPSEVLGRIIKAGHESVLEHIKYQPDILHKGNIKSLASGSISAQAYKPECGEYTAHTEEVYCDKEINRRNGV